MPDFHIVSPYKMAGDQPEAVAKLVEGINNGLTEQTLMGVTGSGKMKLPKNLTYRLVSQINMRNYLAKNTIMYNYYQMIL